MNEVYFKLFDFVTVAALMTIIAASCLMIIK